MKGIVTVPVGNPYNVKTVYSCDGFTKGMDSGLSTYGPIPSAPGVAPSVLGGVGFSGPAGAGFGGIMNMVPAPGAWNNNGWGNAYSYMTSAIWDQVLVSVNADLGYAAGWDHGTAPGTYAVELDLVFNDSPTAAACGDGTVNQSTEGCDDGNTTNGDGCSASCLIENGVTCGAAAGGATGSASCAAGACDAADNKCGLANTHGACTVANQGTVCRSGACDPVDGLCGVANGNGACTVANQATTCRSGTCSPNASPAVCMPAGGCAADADCAADHFCNVSTFTCTGKLANGVDLVADPKHAPTPLAAICSPAVAAIECASGVCDPLDNKCGLADQSGVCSAANQGLVCRSGLCSASTKCIAVGTCDLDADCAGGNWCSISTHACMPKIANGGAMPSDPTHASPTLNGVCDAAAAALVCQGGVCDPLDNKCGLANGSGACRGVNAGTVCRSGACSLHANVCIPSAPGSCHADADCEVNQFCNVSTFTCTGKVAGGALVPDPNHAPAPITATCTPASAAIECAAAVCDTKDDLCGLGNGSGACTVANQATLCRSGACSPNASICVPAAGGCAVDSDCAGNQFCNTSLLTCTPKVANGGDFVPDPNHAPTPTTSVCTEASALVQCVSAVCDVVDNKCGYADGGGSCDAATAATVCRSGACGSASHVCVPAAAGCAVDGDCAGNQFCNQNTLTCTSKVANGGALVPDPKHTPAPITSTCTAASALIECAAAVCDTADNLCGFASGNGACSAANAGTVCRSGLCSANGKCLEPGTCAVDGDCIGGWCNQTTHICAAKVANSGPMPTDAAHAAPTLDGKCNADAAALTCVSLVCSTANNECGYANGEGACSAANAATVCQSGACSATTSVCVPTNNGCAVDADCGAGKWCQASTMTCQLKVANGGVIPTDPKHAPVLDGLCTPAQATACASGVCDATDNLCGHANGVGTCSTANAVAVCRSGACSQTAGVCVPTNNGCAVDSDCAATQWCEAKTMTCKEKLSNGAAVPTDPTHAPVFDGLCSPEEAAAACASSVCDTADNKCGYADGNGSCTAANATTVCRSGSCSTTAGKCLPAGGCLVDADCTDGKWCNSKSHQCTSKTPNGTALPADTGHAPMLDGRCTTSAAALTCQSGVCDAEDNKCGYADGNGSCTQANANAVCRSGFCGSNGKCEPAGSCAQDGDCPGAWCNLSKKTCAPLGASGSSMPTDPGHGANPVIDGTCNAAAAKVVCEQQTCDSRDNACGFMNGAVCTQNGACRSGNCDNGTCAATPIDDGGSLAGGALLGCSTTVNDSSGFGGLVALGVALATFVSRRRKAS